MEQKIVLTFLNPQLQIALEDWRTVYLLKPDIIPLTPEVYKGNLVYRTRGSSKRISYRQIKKGLIRKRIVVTQQVPDWF